MTETDLFLWITKNVDKLEWKTDSLLYPNGVWVVEYRLPGNKIRGNSASPSLSDAIEQAEQRRLNTGSPDNLTQQHMRTAGKPVVRQHGES